MQSLMPAKLARHTSLKKFSINKQHIKSKSLHLYAKQLRRVLITYSKMDIRRLKNSSSLRTCTCILCFSCPI